MLEKEYLGRPLVDGPAPELPAKPIDHIGVHQQADGRFYVGAAPVVGRVSGTPAGPARRHRRGARQRPGAAHAVPEAARPGRRRRPGRVAGRGRCARSAWRRAPSAWRRGTMACTGIEFCKLAIVETKARGEELVARLEERLRRLRRRHLDPRQRLPQRLRPHPGRRHRPQGPAGARARTASRSRASRSTSAAASAWPQGQTAGFGRKLRGLKTTAEELPEYVERLATPLPGRPHRRASRSPSGWSRADEERAAMSDARAAPLYCPYCGEEDLRPHEAVARRLGVPRLRPGLLGQVHRTAVQGSEPMTVVTAAELGLVVAGAPRQTRPAYPDELRGHRRRGRPQRSRAPRPRRSLAGRPSTFGDAVLRDQLDGRRRAGARRLPGRARRRRGLPRHRPALPGDAAGPRHGRRARCRSTCARSARG